MCQILNKIKYELLIKYILWQVSIQAEAGGSSNPSQPVSSIYSATQNDDFVSNTVEPLHCHVFVAEMVAFTSANFKKYTHYRPNRLRKLF
jgi:hypothetical protein